MGATILLAYSISKEVYCMFIKNSNFEEIVKVTADVLKVEFPKIYPICLP